ncbi:hypothetical protein ACHAXS_010670 [Conticribra weissflogii]
MKKMPTEIWSLFTYPPRASLPSLYFLDIGDKEQDTLKEYLALAHEYLLWGAAFALVLWAPDF